MEYFWTSLGVERERELCDEHFRRRALPPRWLGAGYSGTAASYGVTRHFPPPALRECVAHSDLLQQYVNVVCTVRYFAPVFTQADAHHTSRQRFLAALGL